MRIITLENGKQKAIDTRTFTNIILLSSIKDLSDVNEGSSLVIDVDYVISSETKLKCSVIVNKDITLTLNSILFLEGTIEIQGKILGNGALYCTSKFALTNVFVKVNICDERNIQIDEANVYVDCFLGKDTNSGLAANLPKRTIAGAKDTILGLCNSSTNDVIVNFRSGRYEIEETVILNFQKINNNQNRLILKPNFDEKVVFSSVIRYFNLNDSVSEDGFYKIEKPDNEQYFHLVDFVEDENVDLASSEFCVNDNEFLFSSENITIVQINGTNYAKIKIDTATNDFLKNYDLNSFFINVPQWFTLQFSKIIEYNKSEKYILFEIEQNISEAYYNGYRYFNVGANVPFWIYGKFANKNQKNSFWSDSTYLYVKQKGIYITSGVNLQEAFKSSSTGKLILENIEFKYFTDSYLNLRKNNTVNITNRSSVLTLLNQEESLLDRLSFKHCVQNAMLLYNQRSYNVFNNELHHIGESAIVAYGNGNITLCDIEDTSKISPHRGAIYVDETSNVALNKIRDVGYTGIRFCLQPELLQNHTIRQNEIVGVGEKNKKSKVMDGGAIYGYGSNPNGTFSKCEISENKIKKVYSDKYHRGIFLDDGVRNVKVFDNIIVDTNFYSIDIRQVNGLSDNNEVYNNICEKAIRLEGNTTTTNKQLNNVVLRDEILQNKFVNTTTNTTKKCAYFSNEGKVKLKLSELPFVPKAFLLDWIMDDTVIFNVNVLNVLSKGKCIDSEIFINSESYSLEATASGNRLVGKKITGSFIEGIFANVKKYLREYLGTVAFNSTSSITSFKNRLQLAVKILGSRSDADYAGIDFSGNVESGNTNENPTGRIAVRSSNQGSYMKFGTSNSYASGITNEAFNIDPAGNVGFGGETNPNSSIGVKVFGKKVFKGGSLTTAEINILTGLEEGCEVWDTTIKKKKLWNGTTWEVIQSS